MYGIMSRGYICPIKPIEVVVIGPGPTIVDAAELKPEIDGASLGPQPDPPSIQAAEELVPEIQGATAEPVAAPPDPPTITGGSLLVPTIQGGEED
jgi:hypothetical protein